jgi:competence ComEA-like helix-hairpin-helix protein
MLRLQQSRTLNPVTANRSININTASAQHMSTMLHGIGPNKAAAIVLHRQRFGVFKTVDDLAHVDGISPVTLGRIKPYIRVLDTPVSATKVSTSAAEINDR